MPAAGSKPTALDSSIAVPLLIGTHDEHPLVRIWARGRELALTGHSLAETYSVLTRLPNDVRFAPVDAAHRLAERFAAPLLMKPSTARALPSLLAERNVAGGAVYDALVALAAADNGCVLATRDARARGTYEAIGVEVELVS
jgi:predicted nucleic acid-binding protein